MKFFVKCLCLKTGYKFLNRKIAKERLFETVKGNLRQKLDRIASSSRINSDRVGLPRIDGKYILILKFKQRLESRDVYIKSHFSQRQKHRRLAPVYRRVTRAPGGGGGTPILDLTGMLIVTFRG